MSTADRGTPDRGPVQLLLAGLCVALAVVSILLWVVLVVSHIDDRYHVGHVQGAWMTLAAYVNEGVLYPPLYDGEHYGGTRWMPIPIVLHALAAQVTGEYLVSGKALSALFAVSLLALVLHVVRRAGCPWPIAIALVAVIPATRAGLFATTSIGGDVLPVVLQLGALALVVGVRPRVGVPLAGLLAGLAVAAKLSALWAVPAVVVWLAIRRRRRDAVAFVAVWLGTAAAVLGAAHVASDGRIVENLVVLGFAGTADAGGLLRGVNQVFHGLGRQATEVWALVPLAVLAILVAGGWRRTTREDGRLRGFTVHQVALLPALLILTVVYTDVGTGLNQLVDVVVLLVVVIGELAGRFAEETAGGIELVRPLVALAVLWVLATGSALNLAFDVRSADPPTPVTPLVDVIDEDDVILSEDPYVPLAHGRTPTVLDAFMLLRLDRVDAGAVDDLIARIEGREFDHVILVNPLDEEHDFWWENFHFGPRIVGALRTAYEPSDSRDGYLLYEPVGGRSESEGGRGP